MISLLISIFLSVAAAKTHVLGMGGGGEPSGATTMFDDSFVEMIKVVKSKGYSSDFLFDGEHARGNERVARALGRAPEPFNSENYFSKIDSTIKYLAADKYQNGDQLLVIIDTHGAQSGDDNSPGHFIATDGQSAQVHTGQLATLKSIAKSKGVKLGIVDMSCYSGKSQGLADENTCVISAGGSNQVSWGAFATRFVESLEWGGSLETVFLRTLDSYEQPSLPQISTTAGQAMRLDLNELEFLSGYRADGFESAHRLCSYSLNRGFENLEVLARLSFTRLNSNLCPSGSEYICRELESAKSQMAEYTQTLKRYNRILQKGTTPAGTVTVQGRELAVDWNTIAIDYVPRDNSPGELEFASKTKELKRGLASNREFAEFNEVLNNTETLHSKAVAIHQNLRQVQMQLYQRARKPNEKNACTEFKL